MALGLRGFPDVQGGVEKHAEHLYPLLVRLGCEVDVIVRSPYMPRETREWSGVRFIILWAPRINGIEAFVHTFLGVLYAAVARPDVLHMHAIGPAIMTPLARLLGLRVVVTHHGPDYDREKWGRFARWLLRLGEKWGMRYANQRIAISEVIRGLVKEQHGVDSVVIPNGVDLPEIPETTNALDKYGIERRRYVLLVSRFVPEKRHLDLMRAFSKASLPEWKLVLVGDADHPDEYSRTMRAEANKVPGIVLTGYQSGLALRELYAHAGLFVLPSSHEGLPIAMLEALSYGVPVIASDIPANLEIGLPKENYFPLGNISELEELIKRFSSVQQSNIAHETTRAWLRDKYNWETVAKKTLEVYRL
ncbi:MAG: group 1 glycosyl transferase [Gammaproteobacteria bacterium]|nr:MAG: group 1 glycosyl transferase [Gammaproteobacteria bacterium]TND04505.1 MAG: group 1 glycosyl transferase [Gammaproteobacteria bacterium]